MIVIGIIGTVTALFDYSSSLLGIGRIGYVVVNIATGVLVLRAKELRKRSPYSYSTLRGELCSLRRCGD